MDIGKYIKEYLKAKKLTIRWLADQIGMDERTLGNKLNRGQDKRFRLTAAELVNICNVLNLDLNELKELDDLSEIEFNKITAGELLHLGKILDIDLNNFQKKL